VARRRGRDRLFTREEAMEDKTKAAAAEERIPAFQMMLDNPFLLLFLGIALPTVLYIVWGVMEIVGIPISPLAK
jgi:hypothetical protein